MTQPNGQPLQLIICNECGSVRAPVPAIVTTKIMTLQMNATVAPCPVCVIVKALEPGPELRNMLRAEQPEPEESNVVAFTGGNPA